MPRTRWQNPAEGRNSLPGDNLMTRKTCEWRKASEGVAEAENSAGAERRVAEAEGVSKGKGSSPYITPPSRLLRLEAGVHGTLRNGIDENAVARMKRGAVGFFW